MMTVFSLVNVGQRQHLPFRFSYRIFYIHCGDAWDLFIWENNTLYTRGTPSKCQAELNSALTSLKSTLSVLNVISSYLAGITEALTGL